MNGNPVLNIVILFCQVFVPTYLETGFLAKMWFNNKFVSTVVFTYRLIYPGPEIIRICFAFTLYVKFRSGLKFPEFDTEVLSDDP